MKDKMWGILVHLGTAVWSDHVYDEVLFDNDVWDEILEYVKEKGLNTIVLDLAEGVCYGSHPELAKPKAWTRNHVKAEVKRAKEMGITLIPKVNFSTMHDDWLGEYGRMVSTKEYYKVCRDIITEVNYLFDNPPYIHLGMDEEDAYHVIHAPYALYRQKELLWHDLNFLCDCVRDTGSTPWIWSCFCFDYPEDFRKNIDKDVVLSPWQYNALYEEHYTSVSSRQCYIDYYSDDYYKNYDIKFVEDDPWLVNYRKQALPAAKDGYRVVPAMSLVNRCEYNHDDTVRYYKENTDDQTIGFVTTTWKITSKEHKDIIFKTIDALAEAKEKYYK